jgi:hypothetical protein
MTKFHTDLCLLHIVGSLYIASNGLLVLEQMATTDTNSLR